MNKLINENGDVFLKDKNGKSHHIASISYGSTFNLLKYIPKQVTKISIKAMNLTDDFYFLDNAHMYRFLQTSLVCPKLRKVYHLYFLLCKPHSPEAFLAYVIKNYFNEIELEIPCDENGTLKSLFSSLMPKCFRGVKEVVAAK